MACASSDKKRNELKNQNVHLTESTKEWKKMNILEAHMHEKLSQTQWAQPMRARVHIFTFIGISNCSGIIFTLSGKHFLNSIFHVIIAICSVYFFFFVLSICKPVNCMQSQDSLPEILHVQHLLRLLFTHSFELWTE